jgi:multiple sugar transport system permease protein
MKRKGLLARIWEARAAYGFIAPAYVLFIAFVFLPLIQALYLSFFNAGLTTRTFVGLRNFVFMIGDEAFGHALVNTVVFVVILVPCIIALSLLIAVFVFPRGKGVQTFFRMAFYLPVVASGVVLAIVWLWIFNPVYGLLNWLVGLVGIPPVQWLSDHRTALPSLALVVLSWTLGGPLILYLAALGSIPTELFEAAMLDGAGGFRKLRSITLPLLKPTTLFVLVTQTIGVFQVFVVVYLMTAGGPAFATQTIVYRIWEVGFDTYAFGYASAMGMVLLLIVGTISFIQFKFLGAEVEY